MDFLRMPDIASVNMFSCLDVWEDRMARSPAGQMALDEALLLGAKSPTLRLYRWAAPAATFGYAQKLADVRLRSGALPVVRRWTGGGIVFHGADLTLALAVPSAFDLFRQRPEHIYHEIHRTLLPAVKEFFPTARLVLPGDCLPGPACFEAPALHDIIAGGIKICGGALRRGRHGLLYQGSLHIDEANVAATIANAFSSVVAPLLQTRLLEEKASELEKEKYGTDAWNAMR